MATDWLLKREGRLRNHLPAEVTIAGNFAKEEER